jgi:hypothetical protein
MGMMFGDRPAWSLAVGGMMVMAAVMMGSRMDGQYRDAALGVGAVGLGLVIYYLVSGDSTPAAGQRGDGASVAWQRFSAGLDGGTALLGVGWRW